MKAVLTLIMAPGQNDLNDVFIDLGWEALKEIGVAGKKYRVEWLSPGEACDVFFVASGPVLDQEAITEKLLNIPFDFILQPEAGRKKKLLVADMESTIIAQEMIDELARDMGMGDQISAITAKAMAGEIDYTQSLRQRVESFAGVPLSRMEEMIPRMTLNPGAETLVRTMRKNGAYTAIVSGGFDIFSSHIREICGFHIDIANVLETDNSTLTGRVKAPIVDPRAKEQTLRRFAYEQGLDVAQTCSLGDGANDVPMLRAAGLGASYHGKPIAKEAAAFTIDHGDLTALLFAQGYRRDEFVES